MDQQEDQRRANRHVSRIQRNVQRRNMIVHRRNVVHYRVQNITGNVTVTNNYYFDMNVASSQPNPNPNPGAQYPAALPLSQPVPLLVYGPNQNEAYSANLQVAYVAVPPISHVPPHATHIAIPLTHPSASRIGHAFSPSPQMMNGAAPRNGHANANANALDLAPRFVHVGPGPPGPMNRAAAGIPRLPLPRGAIAPIRISSSTAYANPNGTFVTAPSSMNASTYLAIPSRVNTITYAYSSTAQRVVPPPVQMLNRARITVLETVPPVEEVDALAITEVSSTVDDE